MTVSGKIDGKTLAQRLLSGEITPFGLINAQAESAEEKEMRSREGNFWADRVLIVAKEIVACFHKVHAPVSEVLPAM